MWSHLSPRRRRQFALTLLVAMTSAVIEMISLGSVLPFIAALVDPDALLDNDIVSRFATPFGITTGNQLILPLTIIFIGLALLAGVVRLGVMWLNVRFSVAAGCDITAEVYRRTLHQPYIVHVSRGTSEVISGILDKASLVSGGVLQPVQTIISATVMVLAVTTTLVLASPLAAIGTLGVFGSSYGIITWLSRRRLTQNGALIAAQETRVLKNLQEGLGGVRDVLLDGSQSIFLESFKSVDRSLRRAIGNNLFVSNSPRSVMEAFGMVIIALLAFLLSGREGGLVTVLPFLGALALGGQRILPAIQHIYGGWAALVGNKYRLAEVVDLLNQPLPADPQQYETAPRALTSEVKFTDVRFRYSSEGPWVIDGINFAIPAGIHLGIVGETGCGKTTFVDLLMGLLEPQVGVVMIDGEELFGERRQSWQRSIAHVPQEIFLADASFAENIAFGLNQNGLDRERVVDAARRAQLAEFIESRPKGYDERVGERGVRLSGGQRQRIGIARAFYRAPSVLVLDEATSALDALTEQEVIKAIGDDDCSRTVVIVAHRVTTVRHCDQIIEFSSGRVVGTGTYDELIETSPSFRYAAGSDQRPDG